jgi:hypothetical protein
MARSIAGVHWGGYIVMHSFAAARADFCVGHWE